MQICFVEQRAKEGERERETNHQLTSPLYRNNNNNPNHYYNTTSNYINNEMVVKSRNLLKLVANL